MKTMGFALLLVPVMAFADQGAVPETELSLGGVAIGDSTEAVVARLGQPKRKGPAQDFIDLHYEYPHMRVSFNGGIVAGLHAGKAGACTPKGLCPGDRMDRMRALYGAPIVSDRETGRYYEYTGGDAACWLQIRSRGKRVASIDVACQP
ncbi:MAG: hypothetical protein KF800_10045 [Lysobacter sp.]|nr:hypothetical protein [Lysobacter sp.]